MTPELDAELLEGGELRIRVSPPLGRTVVITVRPRALGKRGEPVALRGERSPSYVVIAGTHKDPDGYITKHKSLDVARRSGLARARRYLNSYKRLAKQKAKQ